METLHHRRMVMTGRRGGAVGYLPTATAQWVVKNVNPETLVLDYGAGYWANQSMWLRRMGFDVIPYDLEDNRGTPNHLTREEMLRMSFDLVMMSNVLNVQSTVADAADLALEGLMLANKMLVFNIPDSPSYWLTTQVLTARERRVIFEKELVARHVLLDALDKRRYKGGMIYVLRKG